MKHLKVKRLNGPGDSEGSASSNRRRPQYAIGVRVELELEPERPEVEVECGVKVAKAGGCHSSIQILTYWPLPADEPVEESSLSPELAGRFTCLAPHS